MIESVIKGHKVLCYDSMKEIPAEAYSKFNSTLLVDSKIGSDTDSLQTHYANMVAYMDKGDTDSVRMILANQLQCMMFIKDHLNLEFESFYHTVHSVDGKLVDDVGEIKALLRKKTPQSVLRGIVHKVKKNSILKGMSTSIRTWIGKRKTIMFY